MLRKRTGQISAHFSSTNWEILSRLRYYIKLLEFLLAAPWGPLTLVSCSLNFARASYLGICTLNHESVVTSALLWVHFAGIQLRVVLLRKSCQFYFFTPCAIKVSWNHKYFLLNASRKNFHRRQNSFMSQPYFTEFFADFNAHKYNFQFRACLQGGRAILVRGLL